MRLLTLNTHSRPEMASDAVEAIAAFMLRESVDVAAFQEVNQSRDTKLAPQNSLLQSGCRLPCDVCAPIGEDNFALTLAKILQARGGTYSWTYLPVKIGYERYDEGLALFWRGELVGSRSLLLSGVCDYTDWRRRMALGIRIDDTWFYSVHTARWDGGEESFLPQWQRLHNATRNTGRVFLMGDFNCPAGTAGEGYDRMIRDGWTDVFTAAKVTQGYRTASADIDGWRDVGKSNGQRIDYILSNDRRINIPFAQTVFDVERGQMSISDHCGVFCRWEREEKQNENHA